MSVVYKSGLSDVYSWPQSQGRVEATIVQQECRFGLRLPNGRLLSIQEVRSAVPLQCVTSERMQAIFDQTHCQTKQLSDGSYIVDLSLRITGGALGDEEKAEGSSSSVGSSSQSDIQQLLLAQMRSVQATLASLQQRVNELEAEKEEAEKKARALKAAEEQRMMDILNPRGRLLKQLGIDFVHDTDAKICKVFTRVVEGIYSSVSVRTEFLCRDKGAPRWYRVVDFTLTGGEKFCSFFEGFFQALTPGKSVMYTAEREEGLVELALLGSNDGVHVKELVKSFKRGDHLTLYVTRSEEPDSDLERPKSSVGETIYIGLRGRK